MARLSVKFRDEKQKKTFLMLAELESRSGSNLALMAIEEYLARKLGKKNKNQS